MQRYNELYDPYTGALEPDENGAYVLYEQAQTEIDALHKECDRLTALLEKPKVLKAHEVTKFGLYWHRYHPKGAWNLVTVDNNDEGELAWYYLGDAGLGFIIAGEFIGPLKQPEV